MRKRTLVVLVAMMANVAHAQPLDDAAFAIDEAEFERALELLARAEEGPLDLAGLQRLLALRALALFGLRDDDALARALADYATIGPEALEGPPRLAQLYAEARLRATAPRLDVDARLEGDVAVVEARWDPPHPLSREVRVHARSEGAEWESGTGSLRLPRGEGGVEYFVEAIGPGGAVLSREGSRGSPRVLGRLDGVRETPNRQAARRRLRLGLGIGIAVAVVAAVVTVVVLTRPRGLELFGPVPER